VGAYRSANPKVNCQLITTRTWVTSISYGVINAGMYGIGSMEISIPTSPNLVKKGKTMEKNVAGLKPHENDIVEEMLEKHPILMTSIKDHMNLCYRLFAMKQSDYGLGNIGMNGNKRLALMGLAIRLNDKVQRLLNILDSGKDGKNESLEDTAMDITNYGAILNTVLKDEWK